MLLRSIRDVKLKVSRSCIESSHRQNWAVVPFLTVTRIFGVLVYVREIWFLDSSKLETIEIWEKKYVWTIKEKGKRGFSWTLSHHDIVIKGTHSRCWGMQVVWTRIKYRFLGINLFCSPNRKLSRRALPERSPFFFSCKLCSVWPSSSMCFFLVQHSWTRRLITWLNFLLCARLCSFGHS